MTFQNAKIEGMTAQPARDQRCRPSTTSRQTSENFLDRALMYVRDAGLIVDEHLRICHCSERVKDWLVSEEIFDMAGKSREPEFAPLPASHLEAILRGTLEGQVFLPTHRGNGDLCIQMDVRPLAETPWSLQRSDSFFLVIARYRTSLRKWLIETHGLTRVEAELAILLGRGSEMAKAAKDMKISIHTARKYLQSVFEKTDVHRQVELVSLLHRQYAGSHVLM